MQHKEFKDLLVNTAMEGVEKLYQQQGQDVSLITQMNKMYCFPFNALLLSFFTFVGDYQQRVSHREGSRVQARPRAHHDDCSGRQGKLER